MIFPDEFEDGRVHTLTVERPEFTVTRTNRHERRGPGEASFHMDYEVTRGGVVERASEEHRFGLFTHEQLVAAFAAAGLGAERETEAVGFLRPLYVAAR